MTSGAVVAATAARVSRTASIITVVPGRRPVRAAQILEHEQRRIVLVQREQLGHERAAERAEDALLVADEPGRHRLRSGLHEGGPAVGELDDAVVGDRVAAALDDA